MMWMNKRPSELDFQKFYYTKVALGEGCGCAERVIDVHEFKRKSLMPRVRMPKFSMTGILQKAGLYSGI